MYVTIITMFESSVVQNYVTVISLQTSMTSVTVYRCIGSRLNKE